MSITYRRLEMFLHFLSKNINICLELDDNNYDSCGTTIFNTDWHEVSIYGSVYFTVHRWKETWTDPYCEREFQEVESKEVDELALFLGEDEIVLTERQKKLVENWVLDHAY